jgi:hypothetical protein
MDPHFSLINVNFGRFFSSAKNFAQLAKFHPIGEFSPNLVTLHGIDISYQYMHACFCLDESGLCQVKRTQQKVLRITQGTMFLLLLVLIVRAKRSPEPKDNWNKRKLFKN